MHLHKPRRRNLEPCVRDRCERSARVLPVQSSVLPPFLLLLLLFLLLLLLLFLLLPRRSLGEESERRDFGKSLEERKVSVPV